MKDPGRGENGMRHVPIWSRTLQGVSFSDVPTAPGGRMPDFCVIGTAKGGTSSLNSYLASHPSIFMCALKEPNYFSTPVMLERGDDWYRGLYAAAAPDQLCGEASTSYTRYPAVTGTAERLAKANPGMKLVYSIREPVSRTESDCLQVMKYVRGVLGEDHTAKTLDAFFHQLSDPDHEFYLAPRETSLYADQLEQFEAHFPREQILIVESEKLNSETAATLARILAFLGLEMPDSLEIGTRQNVTAEFETALREERGLDQFRANPLYGLAKRMLPDMLKRRIRRRLAQDVSLGHLHFSDSLKDRLREKFDESNERLREKYGLALDGWS